MGLFIPDDPGYDESARMTGFYRYKQLLSFNTANYMKANLLTAAGALPLAAGIAYAVLSTSVLVLIPASCIGGAIFGPFLAAMFDTLYRGYRDAPGRWRDNWPKAFRQNFKDSLLPGALTGLILGFFIFMGFLLYWASGNPSLATILWYLTAALLFLSVSSLFWPQLILFRQPLSVTVRNMVLFAAKYLWKVLGIGALLLLWISIYVFFAPWTLILVPFLGFWYILFLTQLIIYEDLNRELAIEAKFEEEEKKKNEEA
ncbi:MAG: hypothetical protein K6E30_03210 [Lachnospiraceae bacterium]|nr:hypothetical protein [Lachnospiraceae bacterium]